MLTDMENYCLIKSLHAAWEEEEEEVVALRKGSKAAVWEKGGQGGGSISPNLTLGLDH